MSISGVYNSQAGQSGQAGQSSTFDRSINSISMENEYSLDPASGVFFNSDFKKHEDLKEMLNSNKDNLKLEAMKRIIGMIAKGRDASVLFPDVVKNVVSKNIELKKLVYIYLERYAEEQQDTALLSISTFQRALKEPNQLIRAGALRVLSSIRVSMIAPIVMLAIRDASTDMSPYVRKTAAHAIPKLYHLDNDTKPDLILVIEKLLSDRTVLVIGSAVLAFMEVCPERVDLIHKVYRTLCNVIGDIDEWGQVVIVNMLTRYARSQFTDPNQIQQLTIANNSSSQLSHEKNATESNHDPQANENVRSEGNGANHAISSRSPSSSSSSGSSGDSSSSSDTLSTLSDDDERHTATTKKQRRRVSDADAVASAVALHNMNSVVNLDADHRLLLRSTRPLLQSRNAAVVMAVAQLYYHVGPHSELLPAVKAMVRLLRSYPEVQELVLKNILTMSYTRREIFAPHLKSFFVLTSDSTRVKLLKLVILTNIVEEKNVSIILRELQTYIASNDREFVAAAIQSIGRCACRIDSVTDSCLNGLVCLLSNKNEAVIAESVIVIKRLLQTQATDPSEIIHQMTRLMDSISVPQAKAAILWLLGEYCCEKPAAINVLKRSAKTFTQEDYVVKLQIMNLAVKLYLTNSQQISLLAQYVFNLAKYDQNYDIRDRARILRFFIDQSMNGTVVGGGGELLIAKARDVFLENKPAPSNLMPHEDSTEFQLCSLSHYIKSSANGYEALPPFPQVAKPSAVRDCEVPAKNSSSATGGHSSHGGNFASSRYEDNDVETDNDENDDEDDGDEDGSEQSWQSSTSSLETECRNALRNAQNSKPINAGGESSEENRDAISDDDGSESTSHSGSDNDASEESESTQTDPPRLEVAAAAPSSAPKSNLDLLLDLDMSAPTSEVMLPSTNRPIDPSNMPADIVSSSHLKVVPPCYVPTHTHELLNRMNCRGLHVTYRYTRGAHLFSDQLVNLSLQFSNESPDDILGVHMLRSSDSSTPTVHEFAQIARLPSHVGSLPATLGIDFGDSMRTATFDIVCSAGTWPVSVKPKVGELMRPVEMTHAVFEAAQARLRGMHEHRVKVPDISDTALGQFDNDVKVLDHRVYTVANVARCAGGDSSSTKIRRYAGQTLSSGSTVLLTVDWRTESAVSVVANSENMVIGSMLLTEISDLFNK